jgi:hypothetical protein
MDLVIVDNTGDTIRDEVKPHASITSTRYSIPGARPGRSFRFIVDAGVLTVPATLLSGSYAVAMNGPIPEFTVTVILVLPIKHDAREQQLHSCWS